jgi:hypothetical protein
LVDVLDRRLFVASADWLAFVPDGLQSFTTKDLATLAATRATGPEDGVLAYAKPE